MTTFLIQVSGEESSHNETIAVYWWEEPIKENVYINYHWMKNKKLKEAWFKAKQKGNHRVILYCTGTVQPYPKEISHVAKVISVEINGKAKMKLEVNKLQSGISLQQIREAIESGELSEKMAGCGSQGFNMGIVEDSDYNRIKELSISIPRDNILEKPDEDKKKLLNKNSFFPIIEYPLVTRIKWKD